MSLWKRGKQYWMDVVFNGQRYRESLRTTDWREAQQQQKDRIAQLAKRAPDPEGFGKRYGSPDVEAAIEAYADERRAQVSPRMVAYWLENSRPLAKFFKSLRLRSLTPAHLASYQNHRRAAGRAAKTINGELSVLRQVMKDARLWYRFEDDYKTLKRTEPPVGRALTEAEQARLLELARGNPRWIYAYTAAILGFYCGMRSCEIKALRWSQLDLLSRRLEIRRSKPPAGWRTPTLNDTCLAALADLRRRAAELGYAEPDYFVFPWHGRSRRLDPTRPMTSWRTAWQSILNAAGLTGVRFHDGRHTAITTLAEKGLPDEVIRAQVGHVSPDMMKTYSHIRRQALDRAAEALEPGPPPAIDTHPAGLRHSPCHKKSGGGDRRVKFPRKIGSSGKTRTSNPPVNSRMLCQLSY